MKSVRGSEISTFKRCEWNWYHGWIRGLVPKVEKQDALFVGTGVHLAMADYYIPGTKRGVHPRETWERYADGCNATMKADNGSGQEEWQNMKALISEVLDEYVEHWKGDESWEVLAPEQRFAVEIPHFLWNPAANAGEGGWIADRTKGALCTFVGTFDLPIRDLADDKVKIVDHKTAKTITTRHLTLDAQASGYCAVGTHTLREQGLIGPREVVNGMLYNFIRKGKPDKRKKDAEGYALNLNGTRSKQQPTPLFERVAVTRTPKERNNQIIRIAHDYERMKEARSRVEQPGGTDNLLKSFSRDCSFCTFYDLCELDESNGDTEFFTTAVFRTADMYSDHADGADNSKIGVR